MTFKQVERAQIILFYVFFGSIFLLFVNFELFLLMFMGSLVALLWFADIEGKLHNQLIKKMQEKIVERRRKYHEEIEKKRRKH
ncbi:MAG TPA: hypothetical protein ENG48_04415 [Candidatus Atribacteria bacterium]|nr:hypothetical protein [Candidatus Atribacteria bacterium]